MKNFNTNIMKRLTLIFSLIAIIAVGVFSMSYKSSGRGGVHFMDWKWGDVSQQAKIRNKPIFVFVGASYCNISARMNFIFHQKEVGSVLNDNFVCNKMYTDDGIMNNFRASNWGVTNVPSFLFFNSEGKLIYKTQGYKDKENMLAEIETALIKIKETSK